MTASTDLATGTTHTPPADTMTTDTTADTHTTAHPTILHIEADTTGERVEVC